jgi:hypothetical protein
MVDGRRALRPCVRQRVWQLNQCFCRLVPALLFFVVIASQALAESTAETASRWGLIGRWSVDCSLAPDADRGSVLSYEVAGDGRLILRRDFGSTQEQADVNAARMSDGNMLNLRIFFPAAKQTREFGLQMQSDGAIRAIYNRDSKGKYTIRDGKFVANGEPTPPTHRCGAGARP